MESYVASVNYLFYNKDHVSELSDWWHVEPPLSLAQWRDDMNPYCPMWPQYGCEQFALTSLTPAQMVSGLFQLVLLFMFRSTMFYHVDHFDSTK